jgi:hypothetical protein
MLGPVSRANVEPTAPGAQDADNGASAEVDVAQLLRSIALKQSLHSTTLRNVARAQESGQSRLQAGVDRLADRLNSIADALRRIEGGRHDR